MKPIYVFLLFCFYYYGNSIAQTNTYFQIPDSICTGEPLQVENLSTENAVSYYWNFCSYNLVFLPLSQNMGNLEVLDVPVFFEIVKEEGTYYGLGNNYGKGLVLLNFGDDLRNTPTGTLLGRFDIIPSSIEGISVHQEEGIWWAFVVAGDTENPSLIRLNFGNSITNDPSVENLGNIGEMEWPHDLLIFEEDDNWYGYTINRSGSTLTRFSFGDNLGNFPVGENMGNPGGLSEPVGFAPIALNGSWHLFICNSAGSYISHLDFGTTLSNDPTISGYITSSQFDHPRDIMFYTSCGEIIGAVVNQETDDLILLDFQNDITNNPVAVNLGNIGGFDFPHSFSNVIRVENHSYFFIPNVYNNTLTRVSLLGCEFADPSSAFGYTPPSVVYSDPGIYTIQLIVNEGLPDQQSHCDKIEVLSSPTIELGNDTTLCKEDELLLSTNYEEAVWQDGSMNNTYQVRYTDWYTAFYSDGFCSASDSIFIRIENCMDCLTFPNAFTPDGDGINDVFKAVEFCDPGFLSFEIQIFNRWGQQVYTGNSPKTGWDGRIDGQAATSDVFAWKARWRYLNQGEEVILERVGDVLLIR